MSGKNSECMWIGLGLPSDARERQGHLDAAL